MISVNEFKNGLTIQVDGGLWRVVEFQHVKPGKGSAFVRSKLKNLRTGAVQEKTFRSTEKVEKAQTKEEAQIKLNEAIKRIDNAASKGVIKANTRDRYKTRLNKIVNEK